MSYKAQQSIKKELENKKREVYESMLENYLKLFFGNDNLEEKGKNNQNWLENQQLEAIKKLRYNLFPKIILYASPTIITLVLKISARAYNMPEKTDNNWSKKTFLMVTSLSKLLREDLKLSNKNLGEENRHILKFYLNDYDDFFKK